MEHGGGAPSYRPGSGQGSSNTCTVRWIVTARLETPPGVENGLIQPSPRAHPPEEIYIARTLVQERQVTLRVLNATHRDQKLTRGPPLAHCEPVTLFTSPDMEQPQDRHLTSKL
jgi:hypothetical protein